MELKDGYKKTDIGIIPMDWDVHSINDLTPKNKKYSIVDGPFGSNLKSIHYRKSGIPIITSGYVTEGRFIATNYLYVDDEKFKQEKRSAVHGGDIVMAKIGERCGTSAILPKEHPEGILSGNALKITIDESKYSTKLISLIFSHHYKSGYFELLRTTGAQPAISMANLKKYKIPLPPLPEQQAIAEVLSDTDNLIQSLEKLIAKKRLIKQGAMKKLLTPKDGWEEKSVFELADNSKKFFNDGDWIEAEHITNTGVRLVQTGNIEVGRFVEKKEKKYIYEESYKKLKCKPLEEGDILICRLAEPAGRACIFPDIMESKVITSVDVTIFRPNPDIANRVFLVNIFSTTDWFRKVYENVGGTTHKRISRGALGRIVIKIPSIREQNEIASILSSIDIEIDSLERKVYKYKNLKQGLMQNLLTGKIRLV